MDEHFIDWPDEQSKDILDYLEEVFPEEDQDVINMINNWDEYNDADR